MVKYKKYLGLSLSIMLLAIIIIPQHKGSAILIELKADRNTVTYPEKLNMRLEVGLSNINNAFDIIPANSTLSIIIEKDGQQITQLYYLNGTMIQNNANVLNINGTSLEKIHLFDWFDIGYNDTLKNHPKLANYIKHKYGIIDANITKSERIISIISNTTSINIERVNDRNAKVKINDEEVEEFIIIPSQYSSDVYAKSPNKFRDILITDYILLFNWNEVRNGNATNLPTNLIRFIDERLNSDEVKTRFKDVSLFNLFITRWKNDANVKVNDLTIQIKADFLLNGNITHGNNINMRLEKSNNKVNFIIEHPIARYTYELLIKNEKVYQPITHNYRYNSYINAYYSPNIFNYTMEIDTSKLDPGKYNIYTKVNTGTNAISSETLEFTIDVPDILKRFEYIKRLDKGNNNVNYKELNVTLNIKENTLIGIREITDQSIDLSNYNLFSRIFEVKVLDPNKINGTFHVRLPYIITSQDVRLLKYSDGNFIEGNNIIKNGNILSADFDDAGIFLVAVKKEVNNNNESREGRERGGGLVFMADKSSSFPILIRTEKKTDTFSIDLTKYGISVNKLILYLNKPTDTLYLKLTIPDKTPSNKFDGIIISHFQFDGINDLDKAEIIFTVDQSFMNATLYQLINNDWILQETVKDGDQYRAITNSLTTFVITGKRQQIIAQDNIEREQLFPLPSNDLVTNLSNKYQYNFNLYGYYMKISMDGIIHSIDTKNEENSIIIKVSNVKSNMILTIPREIIDAKKSDGMDARFIILVDGSMVNYSEERNNDYRTLNIELPNNAKEIQIVGSKVIPEFNIVIIILMVAISITIFSKRVISNNH